MERSGLLDVVVDLGETTAVGVLCLLIEQLACISERNVSPRLVGDQVQYMHLAPRLREKPGEIPHALQIPDANCPPREEDRPVVALSAKDVCIDGGAATIASRSRSLSTVC